MVHSEFDTFTFRKMGCVIDLQIVYIRSLFLLRTTMHAARKTSNHTLAKLAKQIAQVEAAGIRTCNKDLISSGYRPIDVLLPGGGFQPGTLVEWFQSGPGGGAFIFGLIAAREACRQGGMCVVVERKRAFYPPAAVAWGIAPNRLVIVRPQNDRDEIWALTQILRCPQVSAVLYRSSQLSPFDFRRLQLAAESGGTLGCFIRPDSARHQPSWAKVRLLVRPCSKSQNEQHQDKQTDCKQSRYFEIQMFHSRTRGSANVEVEC